MIFPERLEKGDTIAIISPATFVKEEYVRGAAAFLENRGYSVRLMPGALGPSSGSFASSHQQRIDDLHNALIDPDVRAVLCARGGYGCVHLIPHIPQEDVSENPKWLIGFSDVSALHALWQKAGVASLHAPMAKHLTIEPADDPSISYLFSILEEGASMDYEVEGNEFNRIGKGKGMLRGGNLAVLNGLAGTPYDILHVGEDEEVVMFIEDISEAIYAVERMLMRLYLEGSLGRIKGLIIGQFTEYRPDLNHPTMERMIDSFLRKYLPEKIPVAFGFPVGHVTDNYPLVEGAMIELEVNPDKVSLKSVAS